MVFGQIGREDVVCVCVCVCMYIHIYMYMYIYVYICMMEYYSAIKKEWSVAICNDMDGARECNAKWNKSVRERQIS